MLFPQQISEGAIGLLKGAQLLQEKFLLPRQGVDVGASHLFLLEEKLCYMAQGGQAHAHVTQQGEQVHAVLGRGGTRKPNKRSWAKGR